MRGIEEKEGKLKQITNETKRITNNYKEVDAKKRAVVRGLIQRAAFMRVELDDLEDNLLTHGWTEWFSQGDQEPYKRDRPEAVNYHKLNAGYQKIIKQLTDLLPKEEIKPSPDDGFAGFVSGRDDG